LGVVNFAHGALFMLGAFCAVSLQKLMSVSKITIDPSQLDFFRQSFKGKNPLHCRVVWAKRWKCYY